MRWSLKASEKVGKKIPGQEQQTRLEWVTKLEEEGNDTTGMLDERPELFMDLTVHWDAFHILSSSRNSGMSVGAIPLPAYESYFRIFGIDSLEEQLEYIKFVGVLDSEFLQWQGEKSESDRQKKESKPKQKGPTARKR